jgi:hypothetical protein
VSNKTSNLSLAYQLIKVLACPWCVLSVKFDCNLSL